MCFLQPPLVSAATPAPALPISATVGSAAQGQLRCLRKADGSGAGPRALRPTRESATARTHRRGRQALCRSASEAKRDGLCAPPMAVSASSERQRKAGQHKKQQRTGAHGHIRQERAALPKTRRRNARRRSARQHKATQSAPPHLSLPPSLPPSLSLSLALSLSLSLALSLSLSRSLPPPPRLSPAPCLCVALSAFVAFPSLCLAGCCASLRVCAAAEAQHRHATWDASAAGANPRGSPAPGSAAPRPPCLLLPPPHTPPPPHV
jgi:hypothetical protein